MTDKNEYSRKDPQNNNRLEQNEKNRATIFIIIMVFAVVMSGAYFMKHQLYSLMNPAISQGEFRQPKDTPKAPTQPADDESRVYDLSKPPHKQ